MSFRVLVALVAVLALSACDDHPVADHPTAQPTPTSSSSTGPSVSPPPASTPPASTPPDHFHPAAYDGWLDDIPDRVGAAIGAQGPARSLCGHRAFRFSQPPVVDSLRGLRLFTDDGSAHQFALKAQAFAARCSDAQEWHPTRVGNAVLLTSGQTSPAEVRALCAFRPQGCRVRHPDVPAGFPLAAGYPDDDQAEGPGAGLAGPSRALPAPTWELCGRQLTLAAGRDRVAAQWSNPEDFRGRQLYTFADANEAVAFVGRLTDFWRSCPHEPSGTDFVAFQTVVPTSVGGQSVALVRHQEYQGGPGLGIVVNHVVRLGRAVLVDEISNEGGIESLDRYLDSMIRTSAPAVEAMCAYTEAGC